MRIQTWILFAFTLTAMHSRTLFAEQGLCQWQSHFIRADISFLKHDVNLTYVEKSPRPEKKHIHLKVIDSIGFDYDRWVQHGLDECKVLVGIATSKIKTNYRDVEYIAWRYAPNKDAKPVEGSLDWAGYLAHSGQVKEGDARVWAKTENFYAGFWYFIKLPESSFDYQVMTDSFHEGFVVAKENPSIPDYDYIGYAKQMIQEQVDQFTDEVVRGDKAAVVIDDGWINTTFFVYPNIDE